MTHTFRGVPAPDWLASLTGAVELQPIGYLFDKVKYVPGPGKADEYQRLSLTMRGVLPRSKDDNEGLQPGSFDDYQLLRPNQLVFKLIDLENVSTSRVGISDAEGLVSPAYIVVEATDSVMPKYAYWYFTDLYNRQIFNRLGEDGVRSSLSWEGLKKLPFPSRRLKEQERIVRFLDEETAKIDHLIEKQEEFRESIIRQVQHRIDFLVWGHSVDRSQMAVSREYSPRPAVSMALSQPLASIPNNWNIGRFKRLFTRKRERNNDGNAEMLSLRQSGEVVLRSETQQNQEPAESSMPKYLIVSPGELVINPMWLTGGAIGVSELYGAVSPDYRVFNIDEKLLQRYAHWLLRSTAYRHQYKLFERASTTFDRRIQQIDLDDLAIPIPPHNEQASIVGRVESVVSNAREVEKRVVKSVSLLRERRSALITAAVTGQIEV